MARSRINFKSINMEKDFNLYKQSASNLIEQFRPSELMALLKIEPKSSDLCTIILKLHLQFLKLEAYEYCAVTRDFMEDNCY